MEKLGLEEIMAMASNCNKEVKVKDVSNLFEIVIRMMYQQKESILKDVEKKIGEKDFFNMLMSIQGTFISTLFANVQFEKKEDAIAFGKMIGDVQSIKVRKDN